MNIKVGDVSAKRLEQVLIRDKKLNPKQIENLLKSDLTTLLENYMTLENLQLKFEIINGEYLLKINASALRIKTFGVLPS